LGNFFRQPSLFQLAFDTMPHFIGHFKMWTLISPGFKVSDFGNDRVLAPLVYAFFQFTGNAGRLTVQCCRYGRRLKPFTIQQSENVHPFY
jgi:hypothetical protein